MRAIGIIIAVLVLMAVALSVLAIVAATVVTYRVPVEVVSVQDSVAFVPDQITFPYHQLGRQGLNARSWASLLFMGMIPAFLIVGALSMLYLNKSSRESGTLKNRSMGREVAWVATYALGMTGIVAIPLVFVINTILYSGATILGGPDEMLMIICGTGFLFFMCVGAIHRLTRKRQHVASTAPGNVNYSDGDSEPEIRLTQELYQISQRMEERMEALETILLDRASTPHHPVRAEREDS